MHGECDAKTKQCKCDQYWQGNADCSKCTSGWTGADCKTKAKDDNTDSGPSGFIKFLTIAGLLLAVFACFGGAAWVAWAQYKKYNVIILSLSLSLALALALYITLAHSLFSTLSGRRR